MFVDILFVEFINQFSKPIGKGQILIVTKRLILCLSNRVTRNSTRPYTSRWYAVTALLEPVKNKESPRCVCSNQRELKFTTHELNAEGFTQDVFREGSHDFTAVRLDDSGEKRNGSGGGLFRKESENTQHSKTSVVDFDLKSSGLLFITLVLAEFEGIVEAERNRVRDSVRSRSEVGVVTGLSSLHVMGVFRGAELGPEFQESNEGENLPLSAVTDTVPKLRGVGSGGERSSIHLHGPWELDSVGVDDVSNEGEHSNTSVPNAEMKRTLIENHRKRNEKELSSKENLVSDGRSDVLFNLFRKSSEFFGSWRQILLT